VSSSEELAAEGFHLALVQAAADAVEHKFHPSILTSFSRQ
jgi:hypothetical protein